MASGYWNIDDVEQTEDAILQRRHLMRVRCFLLEHNAEEKLVETIDTALAYIEWWISRKIETALQNGILQCGEA